MAIPITTHIANSAADVWTDLVEGPATLSSLLVTAAGLDTTIRLRLLKAGGGTIILPGQILAAGNQDRPALGGLSLMEGDKLQVSSTNPASWVATAAGAGYENRVQNTVGGDWKALITGAAKIRSLIITATTDAPAVVAVRLTKASGSGTILSGQRVAPGAAARLLMEIVSTADDSIEITSSGPANWIASGVETA